jgi:hypothetical protein
MTEPYDKITSAFHAATYGAAAALGAGDGWRELGPGSTSVQKPEVVHALRTTEEPIHSFWVWTGDLTAPIWALDDNGERFYPVRIYR